MVMIENQLGVYYFRSDSDNTHLKEAQRSFFEPRSHFYFRFPKSIELPLKVQLKAPYYQEDFILNRDCTVSTNLEYAVETCRNDLIVYLFFETYEKVSSHLIEIKIPALHIERNFFQSYVTVSGKITDSYGVGGAYAVNFVRDGFPNTSYLGTWSGTDGEYNIRLPKGKYHHIYVDDERYGKDTLENWSWQMEINENQSIDFTVGTGEVYEPKVIRSFQGLMVLFRPMELSSIMEKTSIHLNETEATFLPMAPDLDEVQIRIWNETENTEVPILMKQVILEEIKEHPVIVANSYLLQVDFDLYAHHNRQRFLIEYFNHEKTIFSQGRIEFLPESLLG